MKKNKIPLPEWSWKRTILVIALVAGAWLLTTIFDWPSWIALIVFGVVLAGSFAYDMFEIVGRVIDDVRIDLQAQITRQAEMNLAIARNLEEMAKRLAWIEAGKPADLSVTDPDFENKLAWIMAGRPADWSPVKCK